MRFILAVGAALGMGTPAIGQTSGPGAVDVLRISEAFRLARAVEDSVWPGALAETPFPVLLVTPEREFLVGYPRVPAGFTESGCSTPLQTRIFEREPQFQPTLLATFPAFGLPSVIVVGRAEATGKTSSTWVLTLLHEHFHQYQNSDPGYYSAVEQLGLSGGDQTGMWMLNYPFPYDSAAVVERFSVLSRELRRLVEHSSVSDRRAFWRSYVRFLEDLSDLDRRYLSFQVWQEGIARYVELRVSEAAAHVYTPTLAFQVLPDFKPFASVAAQMRASVIAELGSPNLPERRRVSFYAFGAGLALLLDEDAPGWKSRYLREKFFIERYLEPAG